MRVLGIVALGAALAGCAASAPPVEQAALASPPLERHTVVALEVVVCLMVNAKNSYGGYTGEKPYMGVLTRDKKAPKFLVVPADDRFPEYRDQSVYKVCNDYGLSPV
jgi:hypothetical protein